MSDRRYRPELWNDEKRQLMLDDKLAKWFTFLEKAGYIERVEERVENGKKIIKVKGTDKAEGYLGTKQSQIDFQWFLETGETPKLDT